MSPNLKTELEKLAHQPQRQDGTVDQLRDLCAFAVRLGTTLQSTCGMLLPVQTMKFKQLEGARHDDAQTGPTDASCTRRGPRTACRYGHVPGPARRTRKPRQRVPVCQAIVVLAANCSPDGLIQKCKQMIANGYRIESIREYRNETGCSLNTAMRALGLK